MFNSLLDASALLLVPVALLPSPIHRISSSFKSAREHFRDDAV
jgi:hypothetical protein